MLLANLRQRRQVQKSDEILHHLVSRATRLDPLLRAVFIDYAVRVVRGVVRVNSAGVREVVLRPAKQRNT